MTWLAKAAMAGCTYALAAAVGIAALAVVGVEEARKWIVRRRQERRMARQVDRERASW